MSFRAWRRWFKHLKIDLKWFVLLILFRPILDTTSQITFFSVNPLQIVGVLIFVLITFFYFNKRLKGISNRYLDTGVDGSLKIFFFILLLNLISLSVLYPNLTNIGNALKFILPFYLLFYLKKRIATENDLNGILQAVLYSAIIPFSTLLYETFYSPLNPKWVKDELIYRGFYADPFNYSITFFMTFSIVVYFYLQNIRKSSQFGLVLVIVFFMGVLVLSKINHNLSNATFGVVVIYSLSAILKYKKNFIIKFGLVIGCFFALYFLYDLIAHGFYQTFQKEIAILHGEAPIEKAFHGRMFRWINYFDIWEDLGLIFHFFGLPISGHYISGVMISGGMHSDYVRILFATGFIGLVCYLYFLVKSFFLNAQGEYALSVLRKNLFLIVALFSVTSMPINYQTMMYVVMSVVAYGQKKKLLTRKELKYEPKSSDFRKNPPSLLRPSNRYRNHSAIRIKE